MLADIDRIAFGNTIRMGREGMKMTQEQLAELLQVSTQYVSGLERGKAYPSIRMFISLCSALYLDPNELLEASMPEGGFSSDRPYTLRSGDSMYADALISPLEIWWARSGIADLETFAEMPINELPLSCLTSPRNDSSPFLSL